MHSTAQILKMYENELPEYRLPPMDSWPDLPESDQPPFPTEYLPQELQSLIRLTAQNLRIPEDYVICAILGSASAALVGRVWVQPREGFRTPVDLYLALVGESGTRKSAAMGQFIKPLSEYLQNGNQLIRARNREREESCRKKELQLHDLRHEKDADSPKIEALEKEIAALKCQKEPLLEPILSDTTPEALVEEMSNAGGKAIFFSDEGQFINVLSGRSYSRNGGSANLDPVLKAFDGSSVHVSRKNSGSIYLKEAHLSMTIGLQPNLLKSLVGSDELNGRGMPQRLLYFQPRTRFGQDMVNIPPYPQMEMNRWEHKLKHLTGLYRDHPLIMTFDRESDALYRQQHQSIEDRLNGPLGGILQSWSSKAHGQLARLAAILELLQDPSSIRVQRDTMDCATQLMEKYFIPQARYAFGGGFSLTQDAKHLLAAIGVSQSFSPPALRRKVSGQQRFRSTHGKQIFDTALRELQTHGYIRPIPLERKSGAGRPPAPDMAVNPLLLRRLNGTQETMCTETEAE